MSERAFPYTLTDQDLGVSFDLDDHSQLREVFDLLYPPQTRHWFPSEVIDFLCGIEGRYLWTEDSRESLDMMGVTVEPGNEYVHNRLIGQSGAPLHEILTPELRDHLEEINNKYMREHNVWRTQEIYHSEEFRDRKRHNPPGGVRIITSSSEVPRAALKATGGDFAWDSCVLDKYVDLINEADLNRFPGILASLEEAFVSQHGRQPDEAERKFLATRASMQAQESVMEDYVNEPVRIWHEKLAERCEEAGWPVP